LPFVKSMCINSTNKREVIFAYLGEDRFFLPHERQAESGFKRAPKLGLMYLCGVVKKRGIPCTLLDQNVNPFTPGALLDIVEKKNPLFLGIHTATQLKKTVIFYIQFLRDQGVSVPIVVGGPGYFSAASYLEAGADYVCRGEGEITISELTDYLLGCGDSLGYIKGISYKENGKIIDTPDRKQIGDLDTLPFPDWDAVNIWDYGDERIINMKKPYATMMASRGCFGTCAYCSSPRLWGKPRLRTPKNVIGEIDHLVKKYGVKYIGFKDDVFGFDQAWLEEFCLLFEEKKFNLLWSCSTCPMVFMKDGISKLKLFERAHCDLIILGLQKTDPEILKRIGRNPQEIPMVEMIVKECKKLGISTVVEFIFGLPGETKETMTQDLKFSMRVRPDYIHCYHLLGIEGSSLYDEYFSKHIKPTALTEKEIQGCISRGMLAFYLNPFVIGQHLRKILLNPRFIFVGIIYVSKLTWINILDGGGRAIDFLKGRKFFRE